MDEEEDFTPREDFARMRAMSDQAQEELKAFAVNLWVFYEALVKAGFDTYQAIHLCSTMLAQTLGGGDA